MDGFPAAPSPPVFYFHLGSPESYLAAERLSEVLPVPADWVPVDCPYETNLERSEIERAASEQGLQPVRWPARWPPSSDVALRAATYAKSIGRVTAFSLAAFRQTFAAGRDLDSSDTVVIAGAACEIHPGALLKAIELRSVALALRNATAEARASGVSSVPALVVDGRVFAGNTALPDAAGVLGQAR